MDKGKKIKELINHFYRIKSKIFCIVIGFLMLLFGILSIYSDNNFDKNAKETVGIVSKINSIEKRDADNNRYTQNEVYVQYIVDDKKIEEKLNESLSNVKKGDKITLYYNSTNPREVRLYKDDKITEFIYIVFGAIIFAIGMFVKSTCFVA